MEEPLSCRRAFGLDATELDELEVRIEDILPGPGMRNRAAEEPLAAGGGHGHVALQPAEYDRRSHCGSFGVSQGTVSDVDSDSPH